MAVIAHRCFLQPQQFSQAAVGKAFAFQLPQFIGGDGIQRTALEALLQQHQFFDLRQEPGIDPGPVVHFIQAHAFTESIGHVQDAFRPGFAQFALEQRAAFLRVITLQNRAQAITIRLQAA